MANVVWFSLLAVFINQLPCGSESMLPTTTTTTTISSTSFSQSTPAFSGIVAETCGASTPPFPPQSLDMSLSNSMTPAFSNVVDGVEVSSTSAAATTTTAISSTSFSPSIPAFSGVIDGEPTSTSPTTTTSTATAAATITPTISSTSFSLSTPAFSGVIAGASTSSFSPPSTNFLLSMTPAPFSGVIEREASSTSPTTSNAMPPPHLPPVAQESLFHPVAGTVAHCISASPPPALSYHELARAAHYLSAAVSRITTEHPSDLADILKDFAYSLELVSLADAIIVAWKIPTTILLPPLPAITNRESVPLQVQEHIIVGVYPLHHLLALDSEMEFQTLLPGRCLKLTGSKIRRQLFNHSHVVVHLLRDEIRAYDCDCASIGGRGNINIYIILAVSVAWAAFKIWKRRSEQEAAEA